MKKEVSMLFRRSLMFGGLLLMALFSPLSHAEDDLQAELQRQFDEQQQGKARQMKPFDVGAGPDIGLTDAGFLFGWDIILGKRLANTERWGYGLQYHFLTDYMHAIYATATRLDKPFQLKMGVALMKWNNQEQYGLAVGAGVLDRSYFNGKVEVHLMDLEEVFTADRNYTLISASVLLFYEAHSRF